MQSDYYINLHFNQAVAQRTGYAFKIGDKGCTFHLHCEDLDPSGMFPHIVFNHPNNTCVEGVPSGSGRDYAYTIAGNEFGVCGKTVVDLKFYDNNNDATQRISTASFMIEIIPDTYTDFEESSSSYADSLERAREEIDAAILDLQGAEHDLEEAETDLGNMSEQFADTLQDYIDAFGNTAPINPRGEYDPDEQYVPRDAVQYTAGGKTLTYINRSACTGIAPTDPDYGAAHWQIMIDVSVGGSFSALSDVSVDPQTLADGQVPMYNSTSEKWENTDLPTESFEGCSDVDIDSTQLTGGEVPKFNHTSGKWEAGAAVDPADIVNSCTSDATNQPLAAAQGKFLKDLVDGNFTGEGHENLFDNGWFTVNQRVTSSGSANNVYTVDRWITDYGSTAGTWSVSSDGMTLSPVSNDYVFIKQKIDNDSDLVGKVITLSVKLSNGTIYSYTFTRESETNQSRDFDNGTIRLNFNRLSYAGVVILRYSQDAPSSRSIRAVKLELGSVSTLANDFKPNYAIESLRCQRYLFQIRANEATAYIGTGYMNSADQAVIVFPLPTKLAKNPTVTFSGTLTIRIPSGSTATATTITTAYRTSNSIALFINVGTSLTAGVPCIAILSTGGDYIRINSES